MSHATYEIIQIDEKEAELVFHIEENFTLIPAVDLWTRVEDQFAYHLGINDYNFLGRGYTAVFFLQKKYLFRVRLFVWKSQFYNVSIRV